MPVHFICTAGICLTNSPTNLELVAIIVVDGVGPVVVADLGRQRRGRRGGRLTVFPFRTGRLGLGQPLRLPELGAAILEPDLREGSET